MITIERLNKTIEFLQGELEEKTLLVRTLMLRNANNGELLEESFLNSFLNSNRSQSVETTSSIIHSNYSELRNFADNVSTQGENLFPEDIINYDNVISSSCNSFLTIDNLTSSTEYPLSSSFSESIINHSNSEVVNKTFEIDTRKRTYESIDEQITNYRNTNHNHYINEKLYNTIRKSENNNDHAPNNHVSKESNDGYHDDDCKLKNKWPKNTILCASDSMMNQIDENRLSRKFNVKVRCFSGCRINDMYDYLTPLLQKEPDYVILHVGTNDTATKSSDKILNELLDLKAHIERVLPTATIILSQPIIRTDNVKANLTIRRLIGQLGNLDIRVLDHTNINVDHLGKKGLHLNGRGTGRMAMNFISMFRQL